MLRYCNYFFAEHNVVGYLVIRQKYDVIILAPLLREKTKLSLTKEVQN